MDLSEAREKIGQVDREMARLFEERMRAVAQVAAYKKEHSLPVLDIRREEQLLAANAALVEPSLRPYYEDFLRQEMALSRRYQARLLHPGAVGYQGIPGAYSHIALRALFPGGEEISFRTFGDLAQGIVSGQIARGVMPFENSFAGEVDETLDLLYQYDLQIVGIFDLKIRHCLLGRAGMALSEIRRVYSHPQALAQCGCFLNGLDCERIPCLNTAVAAKQVSESGDSGAAAIASAETAVLYGLSVLAPDISSSSENTTRFVILSRRGEPVLADANRFSLLFTLDHAAGRLAAVMQLIAKRGFNMECIRSKPLRDLPWQYYFYVELTGSVETPEAAALLDELRNKCRELKLLGSYRKNDSND